jgi:cytochrome c oxidase subunit 3
MNTAALRIARPELPARSDAVGIGLWVFIGVASTLFALFLLAYVMRLSGSDGSAIALPWQLWLSTALLAAGSVLLQRAHATMRGAAARSLLLAGGACAIAFLAVQGWAWQSLQAANVVLASNPVASFFYLLTALHGVHVLGGLVAWAITLRGVPRQAEPGHAAWRIALCARYWHFLLAVWVVLFAAFSWITPDVARFICGVPP